MVGGGDPVAVAERAADRITHVHLKDVDAVMAERVRRGEITYHEAVVAGLYRPLGRGDVDIAAIVRVLDGAGFDGWIVLEQDTVLPTEPPVGSGADGGCGGEHRVPAAAHGRRCDHTARETRANEKGRRTTW